MTLCCLSTRFRPPDRKENAIGNDETEGMKDRDKYLEAKLYRNRDLPNALNRDKYFMMSQLQMWFPCIFNDKESCGLHEAILKLKKNITRRFDPTVFIKLNRQLSDSRQQRKEFRENVQSGNDFLSPLGTKMNLNPLVSEVSFYSETAGCEHRNMFNICSAETSYNSFDSCEISKSKVDIKDDCSLDVSENEASERRSSVIEVPDWFVKFIKSSPVVDLDSWDTEITDKVGSSFANRLELQLIAPLSTYKTGDSMFVMVREIVREAAFKSDYCTPESCDQFVQKENELNNERPVSTPKQGFTAKHLTSFSDHSIETKSDDESNISSLFGELFPEERKLSFQHIWRPKNAKLKRPKREIKKMQNVDESSMESKTKTTSGFGVHLDNGDSSALDITSNCKTHTLCSKKTFKKKSMNHKSKTHHKSYDASLIHLNTCNSSSNGTNRTSVFSRDKFSGLSKSSKPVHGTQSSTTRSCSKLGAVEKSEKQSKAPKKKRPSSASCSPDSRRNIFSSYQSKYNETTGCDSSTSEEDSSMYANCSLRERPKFKSLVNAKPLKRPNVCIKPKDEATKDVKGIAEKADAKPPTKGTESSVMPIAQSVLKAIGADGLTNDKVKTASECQKQPERNTNMFEKQSSPARAKVQNSAINDGQSPARNKIKGSILSLTDVDNDVCGDSIKTKSPKLMSPKRASITLPDSVLKEPFSQAISNDAAEDITVMSVQLATNDGGDGPNRNASATRSQVKMDASPIRTRSVDMTSNAGGDDEEEEEEEQAAAAGSGTNVTEGEETVPASEPKSSGDALNAQGSEAAPETGEGADNAAKAACCADQIAECMRKWSKPPCSIRSPFMPKLFPPCCDNPCDASNKYIPRAEDQPKEESKAMKCNYTGFTDSQKSELESLIDKHVSYIRAAQGENAAIPMTTDFITATTDPYSKMCKDIAFKTTADLFNSTIHKDKTGYPFEPENSFEGGSSFCKDKFVKLPPLYIPGMYDKKPRQSSSYSCCPPRCPPSCPPYMSSSCKTPCPPPCSTPCPPPCAPDCPPPCPPPSRPPSCPPACPPSNPCNPYPCPPWCGPACPPPCFDTCPKLPKLNSTPLCRDPATGFMKPCNPLSTVPKLPSITCMKPCSDPCSKPYCPDPCSKPYCSDPCTKPYCPDPCSKPYCPDPCSKPCYPDPLCKPCSPPRSCINPCTSKITSCSSPCDPCAPAPQICSPKSYCRDPCTGTLTSCPPRPWFIDPCTGKPCTPRSFCREPCPQPPKRCPSNTSSLDPCTGCPKPSFCIDPCSGLPKQCSPPPPPPPPCGDKSCYIDPCTGMPRSCLSPRQYRTDPITQLPVLCSPKYCPNPCLNPCDKTSSVSCTSASDGKLACYNDPCPPCMPRPCPPACPPPCPPRSSSFCTRMLSCDPAVGRKRSGSSLDRHTGFRPRSSSSQHLYRKLQCVESKWSGVQEKACEVMEYLAKLQREQCCPKPCASPCDKPSPCPNPCNPCAPCQPLCPEPAPCVYTQKTVCCPVTNQCQTMTVCTTCEPAPASCCKSACNQTSEMSRRTNNQCTTSCAKLNESSNKKCQVGCSSACAEISTCVGPSLIGPAPSPAARKKTRGDKKCTIVRIGKCQEGTKQEQGADNPEIPCCDNAAEGDKIAEIAKFVKECLDDSTAAATNRPIVKIRYSSAQRCGSNNCSSQQNEEHIKEQIAKAIKKGKELQKTNADLQGDNASGKRGRTVLRFKAGKNSPDQCEIYNVQMEDDNNSPCYKKKSASRKNTQKPTVNCQECDTVPVQCCDDQCQSTVADPCPQYDINQCHSEPVAREYARECHNQCSYPLQHGQCETNIKEGSIYKDKTLNHAKNEDENTNENANPGHYLGHFYTHYSSDIDVMSFQTHTNEKNSSGIDENGTHCSNYWSPENKELRKQRLFLADPSWEAYQYVRANIDSLPSPQVNAKTNIKRFDVESPSLKIINKTGYTSRQSKTMTKTPYTICQRTPICSNDQGKLSKANLKSKDDEKIHKTFKNLNGPEKTKSRQIKWKLDSESEQKVTSQETAENGSLQVCDGIVSNISNDRSDGSTQGIDDLPLDTESSVDITLFQNIHSRNRDNTRSSSSIISENRLMIPTSLKDTSSILSENKVIHAKNYVEVCSSASFQNKIMKPKSESYNHGIKLLHAGDYVDACSSISFVPKIENTINQDKCAEYQASKNTQSISSCKIVSRKLPIPKSCNSKRKQTVVKTTRVYPKSEYQKLKKCTDSSTENIKDSNVTLRKDGVCCTDSPQVQDAYTMVSNTTFSKHPFKDNANRKGADTSINGNGHLQLKEKKVIKELNFQLPSPNAMINPSVQTQTEASCEKTSISTQHTPVTRTVSLSLQKNASLLQASTSASDNTNATMQPVEMMECFNMQGQDNKGKQYLHQSWVVPSETNTTENGNLWKTLHIGCAEVSQASSNRVVLEGAFVKSGPACSGQKLVSFRLVFIRRTGANGSNVTIDGNFSRQAMESNCSCKVQTWGLRV